MYSCRVNRYVFCVDMLKMMLKTFYFQFVNATSMEKYTTMEKPFTTLRMALETASQLNVEKMET